MSDAGGRDESDDASSALIARLLQEDNAAMMRMMDAGDESGDERGRDDDDDDDDGDFIPSDLLKRARGLGGAKPSSTKARARLESGQTKKRVKAESTADSEAKSAMRSLGLRELLARGLLAPGPDVLSIAYMGKTFKASLTVDGSIVAEDKTFDSVSSWSVACKRSLNPSRMADDGWKSVRYDGRTLHDLKQAAAKSSGLPMPMARAPRRKARANNSDSDSDSGLDNGSNDDDDAAGEPDHHANHNEAFVDDDDLVVVDEERASQSTSSAMPPLPSSSSSSSSKGARQPKARALREADLPAAVRARLETSATAKRDVGDKRRIIKPSIKFTSSQLSELAPHVMFTCETLRSAEQPFKLLVDPLALSVMDIHAHLAHTEIIGYLGGSWDSDERILHVRVAYPCQPLEGHEDVAPGDIEADRTRNVEMDPESELRVRLAIQKERMVIVGWYHSHPTFQSDPSVRDVENQTAMQRLFKCDETGLFPFVGMIVGPYHLKNETLASAIKTFIVLDNGQPVHLPFATSDRPVLPRLFAQTTNALAEMYRGFPSRVYLDDVWRETSRREKLRTSATSRLSVDDASAVELVRQLVEAL